MNVDAIYDNETLAAFRECAPDQALLALVERLVTRIKDQGFFTSCCIAIQPTPDLLGFDPVADPPDWAWRREHAGGWVELGLILDDFTWIILVPARGELAWGG